jgi:superoxide dismutase
LNSVPEEIRAAVRNNGGGHVNHTMFWQIMAPKAGGEPSGAINDAIKDTFGASINSKSNSTMRASSVSAPAGSGSSAQTRAANCKSSQAPIKTIR